LLQYSFYFYCIADIRIFAINAAVILLQHLFFLIAHETTVTRTSVLAGELSLSHARPPVCTAYSYNVKMVFMPTTVLIVDALKQLLLLLPLPLPPPLRLVAWHSGKNIGLGW